MTSQLNVDTIVDKAGSGGTNVKVGNTSTYVSEGGAVTQNTVQSFTKQWCSWDNDSDGIHDSFNTTSHTDVGSGASRLIYINNMSNANYCIVNNNVHDGGIYNVSNYVDHDTPPTTSQFDMDHLNRADGARTDSELNMAQISGDLA